MAVSLPLVADAVARNEGKAEHTGTDDLMAAFGLSRLAEFARTQPIVSPFARLKTAIDRRLFKSPRWQLVDVVEWPKHEFHWRPYSIQEIRHAFTLLPGSCQLPEEEHGTLLMGDALPEPSTRSGMSSQTEKEKKPKEKKGDKSEKKKDKKKDSKRRKESVEPASTEDTVTHEHKRQRMQL